LATTPPLGQPLPRLAKRMLFGVAFSAVGSGLTLPFLFVYYSEVRGIATSSVGLLFAWLGVVSFVCAPLGGSLIDRFGARPVALAGMVAEGIGVGLQAFVRDFGDAFLLATFLGVGTMGLYSATTALMTRLVPEQSRERIYGLQFMLMNAGLGIGGLLGSILIDIHRAATFERLYFLNAAAYLIYIAVLASLPRSSGATPAEAAKPQNSPAGGWRLVLADRILLRVVAISTVVVTCGYAQMETGFTAFAIRYAGVDPKVLGWAFGANTGAIVIGQLVVLRWMAGRRRSRLLALCSGAWAASWLVIALSGLATPVAAVVLVVGGLGLFGLAETLWAPVSPALVNGLAPEHLRGRYNALASMTWTISMVVGPATAGLLLGNGLPGVWVALTVGGTAVAAVGFVLLGRSLSRRQEGLTDEAEASPVEPSLQLTAL
jgi:MFS family permease